MCFYGGSEFLGHSKGDGKRMRDHFAIHSGAAAQAPGSGRSRAKPFPKQFHKLTGAETLFQQTCRRFTGDLFGDLFVLSNHRHRFLIAEQLEAAGLPATNIVKPHRLANPGKIPAFLIEVQSGSYLDESDIVRLDDIYPPRLAQIARPTRGPSRSRPGGAPPPDRKKDQLSAGAGAAAPVQARAPEAEVAAGMKRIRPTMTAITSI